LALLDTLHIEQAHLCGLSLGGMIALWCAIMHPQRVARLVLANTAARIGTNESWHMRIDAVNSGGMAGIRDAILARFLSQPFRQRSPETAQQLGEMVAATDPLGYIGACAALRDADLRALASTVRTPTLIFAGALDESTPPSQAQELHAAIAGSQLIIFSATAHLSNVERPQEFSESVLNFLTHI
jgi:3-oxoadipate enol-lactonase